MIDNQADCLKVKKSGLCVGWWGGVGGGGKLIYFSIYCIVLHIRGVG